jgi:hypothetical protein
MSNLAFIDGQNLHLGTSGIDGSGWKIDHRKLRIYLKDKYDISEAYYFLGFVSELERELYTGLQRAGFILEFREHSVVLKGKKKGNVDCDIVFTALQKLIDESDDFNNIYIVSGDGDYIKLVDYLVKKGRFGKILFPNTQFASSLYKKLGGERFDYLDRSDIRSHIEYKK